MTRIKMSLSLVAILLVGSLFVTGCTTKPVDANTVLTPHRVSVYFVVNRPNGFMAYVPEGAVRVGIKVRSSVTDPYVEVPKRRKSDYRMGEGEFVAWGLGGTLYVKDLEQLKNLIFIK